MSCANRRASIHKDLAVIKVLAQRTADLVGINQIIYRIFCNGITIYKFSDNWAGEKIETITPSTSGISLSRDDSSKDILSNTENRKPGSLKSKEDKNRERKVSNNLE